MTPIKKKSLVDQIYDKLRSGILEMSFEPGSRINVNELQQTLGVSCTPIREAINRLQLEGLVVYQNNVGARVLDIKEKDILDIQQLATALHCTAVRLAMSGEEKDALLRELEVRFAEYCAAENAADEVAAIREFFGTYYYHCGNSRLDKSMLSIQGQQILLRNMYAARSDKRARDKDLFRLMLSQTKAGDADGVCRSMEEYSERMIKALTA